MEEPKKEYQEASIEMLEKLANEQEKFRYLGTYSNLPDVRNTPGDMILLDTINKPLIYIDQWYLLPKAAEKLFIQEDAGDERDAIVEGLFSIVDWPGLPKELVDIAEKAIGLLEKDREDIAKLINSQKPSIYSLEGKKPQ